ncbi:MAG: BREX system ATP-binding domain-containing protein [Chloroflexota bacterium]
MTTETPTQQLGNRYLLYHEIGRGGMGVVYRAKDRLFGNDVALKRVDTDKQVLALTDTLQAAEFRLALAREFKLSASMRHPHIIDVLDYGFDNEQKPYYTMELLTERKTFLQAAQNQTLHSRISLILQLLSALSYLHRRGIVHRDIKPANVLVEDGQVKVLDFGLSTMHDRTTKETSDYSTVGTLAYMAPEVLTGEEGGITADLYAVGMLGYEIIAGEHPFVVHDAGQLVNQILLEFPDVNTLDAPERITSIIQRLIQKDPLDRYPSASAVIAAFTNAMVDIPYDASTAARDSFLQAARFVGREREITQLVEALQASKQGHSSAWLVSGESGMGKSRILDELRTQAMVNGAVVIREQAVAVGSQPLKLWQTTLRWLCLHDELLTEQDFALLKQFLPDVDNLTIANTADIAPTNYSPAEQQATLLALLERVFSTLDNPVVMLFEDLHWASSASLQLLAQWIDRLHNLQVLVIGSYRDDEKPNLNAQFPSATHMQLQGLNDADISELSAAMLGDAGRTEPVVELLRRESEGNIFFIVEVVRALAEEVDNLEQIGRMTLPARVFAGGIQAVLQRRLSRLSQENHVLLRYAALIGREINTDVLQAIMPDTDMTTWLTDSINAIVLDVEDEVYRFAHDKLRVGLIDMIPPAERQDMHATIANTLENLYGEDDAHIAALAHHWGQAGNTTKEERYVTFSGEQALRIGAFQEAISYFQKAFRLVQEANTYAETRKQRKYVHLHQRTGNAHLGVGNYTKARAEYERSLHLCYELEDPVAVGVSLGHLGNVAFAVEDFDQAEMLYEEALKHYRDMNNTDGIVRTLNRLGDVAYEKGDQNRATQLYQESLTLSREAGNDWNMAGAMQNRTLRRDSTGTPLGNLLILIGVAKAKDDTQLILKTMMRLASTMVKEEMYADALELYAFLLYHDESPEEIQDEAEQKLYTIQDKIENELREALWERGKNRTLESMLQELEKHSEA